MLVKRIVRDPGDASRALLFSFTFCSFRLYRPTIRPTLEQAGWRHKNGPSIQLGGTDVCNTRIANLRTFGKSFTRTNPSWLVNVSVMKISQHFRVAMMAIAKQTVDILLVASRLDINRAA